MGANRFRGRLFFVVVSLLISVKTVATTTGLSGDSGEGCAQRISNAGLIVSFNGTVGLQLTATEELKFRDAQIAAAKQRIAQRHALYLQVAKWYVVYLDAYREALASSEASVDDSEAVGAGNRALLAAIEEHLSRFRGDERAAEVLRYFGAAYTFLDAEKLRHLLNVLLIQEYLARFQEKLLERLVVAQPIDTNLYSAKPEVLVPIWNAVLQEIANSKEAEMYHLSRISRIAPLRTYSVDSVSAGVQAEAYARADRAAMESARAKCEALSLDEGLPTALQDFVKDYLVGLGVSSAVYTHPMIVDWAREAELFLVFNQ